VTTPRDELTAETLEELSTEQVENLVRGAHCARDLELVGDSGDVRIHWRGVLKIASTVRLAAERGERIRGLEAELAECRAAKDRAFTAGIDAVTGETP
jgi:hypothetical protein